MVGLDRAGKTTLMERLKVMHSSSGNMPAKVLPTVGLNVGRVKLSGVELVMRDLGGQPSLRSIWEKYYEESDAVMFVVDAAERERFEEAKEVLDKLFRAEGLGRVPFMLVANKTDLQGAIDAPELSVQLQCSAASANGHPYECYTVSGATGLGCKGLVESCIDAIRKHPRRTPNG